MKSGSDWSMNELLTYNTTVQCQDIINFFGHELGSINHLDSNLFFSADPTIRVVHASPIQPQLVPQLGLNFDLNLQDLNFPNRKFSRVEVKVEAF
jgi:hypothetical protein